MGSKRPRQPRQDDDNISSSNHDVASGQEQGEARHDQQKKIRKLSLSSSELSTSRKELPVYKFKSIILQHIQEKDVVLVMAETGSGKSTQIPAYVMEELANYQQQQHHHHHDNKIKKKNINQSMNKKHPHNSECIAVTQPRRVAAMTVAQRVAQELRVVTVVSSLIMTKFWLHHCP